MKTKHPPKTLHTLKKLAILVGVDRRRIAELIKELRIPRELKLGLIVVDDIYVPTIKAHFEKKIVKK